MRIFAAFFLVFVARSVSADTFLVEGGRAQADIVIDENPSRMARLAAEEMQGYLGKISGAKLPISTTPDESVSAHLFIGHSAHTEKLGLSVEGLLDGAYRLAYGDNWLALIGDDRDFVPHELFATSIKDRERTRTLFGERTGGRWAMPADEMDRSRHTETGWWQDDRRGSLNAVHAFLRHLGVRWFMPGELGEVVPTLDSIPLPKVDAVVRPDFALRQFNCDRWDLISKEQLLWHFRLGLNWGGDQLGHGRRAGLSAVLARDEMKRDHPDYYALWDGKRQIDYNTSGAPCLSSEGLFQEHVRYVRAMFDLYDEPMMDIALPDNIGKTGKACECESCASQYTPKRAAGTISDYMWGYMNRVAEEVAKTHPDKKVFAYAYQGAFLPPEKLEKLHPNLVVIIATVWRHERLHPELNPESKQNMDEIRQAWAEKVTSGILYNWEYYLFLRSLPDRPHGVPVYFPHGIAEDLRVLKSLPAMRGEFLEITRNDPQSELPPTSQPWGVRGEVYAPGFSHLNLYVTSRFYWDASQDVDALLADYYAKFFGPAAGPMKAFIVFSEANWPLMAPELRDPATIAEMQRLLATARQAAGDSVFGHRIDQVMTYVRPLTSR